MTALITDEINQSRSPKPETDIGPKIVTRIPPPNRINTHIPKRKPNNSGFKA